MIMFIIIIIIIEKTETKYMASFNLFSLFLVEILEVEYSGLL